MRKCVHTVLNSVAVRVAIQPGDKFVELNLSVAVRIDVLQAAVCVVLGQTQLTQLVP